MQGSESDIHSSKDSDDSLGDDCDDDEGDDTEDGDSGSSLSGYIKSIHNESIVLRDIKITFYGLVIRTMWSSDHFTLFSFLQSQRAIWRPTQTLMK